VYGISVCLLNVSVECALFVQLFYMGLVIFVPATAMEAMTDFPLWSSVIITGTVATVYTTLVRAQPLVFQFLQCVVDYVTQNNLLL